MKKVVVLDLDREEFRFAVGGLQRRQVTLLGTGAVKWQSGAEGAPLTPFDQGNQIREELKGYKLGRVPAILLADRSKVEELNLDLPPVPDAELPQLVKNQALLDSPGLTEETVIDFVGYRSESIDEQRKIVAFALSPGVIERYKEVCGQAGLQLAGIQYRPYAATAVVRQAVREVLETTSLVVTQYRDEVELSLLDGDTTPLSRQVRLPGNKSDEGSAARLLGEIRRTLLIAPQHLPPGRSIADIRVQGGALPNEELCHAIQTDTGLPVLSVNPLDIPGMTMADGVTLILGVESLLGALQLAANEEKPPIDFLNPRKPIVRKSNVRTLVLGGALLAIAWYFAFDYFQQYSARSNQGINDLRGTLSDLKSRLKKIDKERKLAEALNQWESTNPNWLDELRELSVKIPPGQDVTLSRLSMSPGRGAGGAISFSASARTPDAVVALEKALRDERHAIQTPGITQRSDKNYPWGFESTLSVLRKVEQKEEKTSETTAPTTKTAKEKP